MQQWRRNVVEWLEAQWRGVDPPPPSTEPPSLDWLERLVDTLFWIIVISFSAWILWRFLGWFIPFYQARQRDLGEQVSLEAPTKMRSLSAAQYLRHAQNRANQGDYREACRLIYLALLQKLDQRDRIPQDESRTDGEYLIILRQFSRFQPYQTVVQIHERLCFSDATISEQEFQACQRAYQEIEGT